MADVNPNWWQDAIYNSIVGPGGSIQTGLNNTKAALQNQGRQTFSDLGVNVSGDIFGDPTQVKYGIADDVDITNPFSRAALLKKSYMQQQAGNKNSYAARGQFTSGSLQNAQNQAAETNLQGQDAITKQAGSWLSDAMGKWIEARNAAGAAGSGAASDAFARNRDLPGSPYYTPPDVTPDQYAAGGAPAAPAAPSPAAQQPKAGYTFVQDSGTRSGLSYKVVLKDGKKYRYYENGDKVLV